MVEMSELRLADFYDRPAAINVEIDLANNRARLSEEFKVDQSKMDSSPGLMHQFTHHGKTHVLGVCHHGSRLARYEDEREWCERGIFVFDSYAYELKDPKLRITVIDLVLIRRFTIYVKQIRLFSMWYIPNHRLEFKDSDMILPLDGDVFRYVRWLKKRADRWASNQHSS
jgi:hypothetical protein